MKEVITIGLEIAKNVFQIHGVDGPENAVTRRQLRRSQVLPFFKKLPPCLVGIEACATMADAEAICEAVTRPTMRFVEIKTPEQQSVLMLHRTRHLFVRQRTSAPHFPPRKFPKQIALWTSVAKPRPCTILPRSAAREIQANFECSSDQSNIPTCRTCGNSKIPARPRMEGAIADTVMSAY